MAAKAKQLTLSGKKIVDFSVGEPDFNTPLHIRDAAVAAMQAGRHALHGPQRHHRAAAGRGQGLSRAAWPAICPRASGHFQRSQAFAAQRADRALQPGGRSDRAGAVLGQLRGIGQADRGEGRDRRHAAGGPIQADARACNWKSRCPKARNQGRRRRHHQGGFPDQGVLLTDDSRPQ